MDRRDQLEVVAGDVLLGDLLDLLRLQIAFLERGAYAAPRPVIRALEDRRTPDRSIVDVRVNAAPVSVSGLVSVGGASSLALGIAALVGIALGAGLAVYQGRQK